MKTIIFHIDVNSAYLSWSAIEKLNSGDIIDLREVPSIIGGDASSRHGVVLAKSIPAKKFKVQTGESIGLALRKCPSLIIEPPNHKLYQLYSQKLMNLLRNYSPDLEQVSIDECYLDFSSIAHLYDSPVSAAREIQSCVLEKLGFTVNIGISTTKVLAKMASDFEKPNKVHTLWPEEIVQKMWPLPISELYMVGRTSADKLIRHGILTIGDLASTDLIFLQSHFKSHGKLMWEYANGIDSSMVHSDKQEAKGIGNSTTLHTDATSPEEAKDVLLWLAESVASRLRKAEKLASTLAVEIKYSDFSKASRQTQDFSPCNTSNQLYEISCNLFDSLWNGQPIRLLGIRSSNLLDLDTPQQLSLFDLDGFSTESQSLHSHASLEKQKKLDAALDNIKLKYGEDAIKRGSLL